MLKPLHKSAIITDFDSTEEEHFYWWLLELEDKGIISDIRRATSLKLNDALVRKIKNKSINFLEDQEYTADYVFTIEDKTSSYFEDIDNPQTSPKSRSKTPLYYQEDTVWVEVKGAWDAGNMTRLFRINQKQVYTKHGIFVNLVKIPDFFKKSFTPHRFLKTDTGKFDRKLNWENNPYDR